MAVYRCIGYGPLAIVLPHWAKSLAAAMALGQVASLLEPWNQFDRPVQIHKKLSYNIHIRIGRPFACKESYCACHATTSTTSAQLCNAKIPMYGYYKDIFHILGPV